MIVLMSLPITGELILPIHIAEDSPFDEICYFVCALTHGSKVGSRHLLSAHDRRVTRVVKRLPGRHPALWATCAGHGTAHAPSLALSAATTAPQTSAPVAASAVAKAVEAAVDGRAFLAANTAAGRHAGGEVDGGDRWRALLALGPAGRVAGRRDAPVEETQ